MTKHQISRRHENKYLSNTKSRKIGMSKTLVQHVKELLEPPMCERDIASNWYSDLIQTNIIQDQVAQVSSLLIK